MNELKNYNQNCIKCEDGKLIKVTKGLNEDVVILHFDCGHKHWEESKDI